MVAVAKLLSQKPVRLTGFGVKTALRHEAVMCWYGNDLDEGVLPPSKPGWAGLLVNQNDIPAIVESCLKEWPYRKITESCWLHWGRLCHATTQAGNRREKRPGCSSKRFQLSVRRSPSLTLNMTWVLRRPTQMETGFSRGSSPGGFHQLRG